MVVRIRNGKIVGREKIFLIGVRDETHQRMLADFIRQFYFMTHFVPSEIVLPILPEDPETLSEWLRLKREGRINFLVPKRGEKARLLKVTLQNSDLLLKEHLRKKEKRKALSARAHGVALHRRGAGRGDSRHGNADTRRGQVWSAPAKRL